MNENLELCRLMYRYLKLKHPELPKFQKNTVVPFTTSKKLCSSASLGGAYAHYHQSKPNRICIKQKALNNPKGRIGQHHVEPTIWRELDGNFFLAEIMAHEVAHFRTKGHAKTFRAKHLKTYHTIANWFISGDFYKDKFLQEQLND